MPGFKMTMSGAPRPRNTVACARSLNCFDGGEEAPKRPFRPLNELPQDPQSGNPDSDGQDAADPLERFMAGIAVEAAKPGMSAVSAKHDKDAWDELQTDDPVASYCEVYEKNQQMSGDSKSKRKGAEDGDGFMDSDDEGEENDRRTKPIEPLPAVDHSTIEYKQVRTLFYTPHSEIARLSTEDVARLQGELRIAATGSNCPAPVVSFAHLGLPSELMQGIRKHGYVKPTAIQAQAIPAALSGRDVIGVAETGSGKTVAYLMPMLVHCADQPPLQKDEGPIGLVLCPTRELAVQIEKETFKFNREAGLRSTTLAGGLSKFQQFKDIKKGSEIVIGTPGRVIDIIKMKGCNLRRCTFLVLDEADRMMHMGFEPQIRSIVQHVRPNRQTLFFSATFPPKIERMSRDLLQNPIRITVGKLGQAAQNITQHVQVLADDDGKWSWLSSNFSALAAKGQLLIFAASKQRTEDLLKRVTDELGAKAVALHGDMSQDERMQMMSSFSKQKINVLIATDIAARGLDVPTIRTVVSYDIARDIETHTHRVGRTGRAGEKGDAHTLITVEGKNRKMAALLVHHLETVGSAVEDDLLAMAMQHQPFRAMRLVGMKAGEKRACVPEAESATETVGSKRLRKSRSPSRSPDKMPPPTP